MCLCWSFSMSCNFAISRNEHETNRNRKYACKIHFIVWQFTKWPPNNVMYPMRHFYIFSYFMPNISVRTGMCGVDCIQLRQLSEMTKNITVTNDNESLNTRRKIENAYIKSQTLNTFLGCTLHVNVFFFFIQMYGARKNGIEQ